MIRNGCSIKCADYCSRCGTAKKNDYNSVLSFFHNFARWVYWRPVAVAQAGLKLAKKALVAAADAHDETVVFQRRGNNVRASTSLPVGVEQARAALPNRGTAFTGLSPPAAGAGQQVDRQRRC